MSNVFNTGPVEMYTGTGASGILEFLGYSEAGMQIQLRETFEDVTADLLGPKIPIDVQHFQADALITGDLVRWNEAILEKIEDRSLGGTDGQGGTTGAAWGVVSRAEVGALMLAQGKTYRLLCDAPNALLGTVFPGMVAYNFLHVYLHDVMTRKRGARVERVHVTFRALPNFTNLAASTKLSNTSVLYNIDRTGIPMNGPN